MMINMKELSLFIDGFKYVSKRCHRLFIKQGSHCCEAPICQKTVYKFF